MTEIQTYDDIDQTAGEKIRTAAPAFFVNEMKKYIARNSIRTNAAEFAMYCACTWDEQKNWLNQDNIVWAIRYMISELPFSRMPTDTDWAKPRTEFIRQEYYQKQEEEQRKRLLAPRKKATPEQIARVEQSVAEVTKKLSKIGK